MTLSLDRQNAYRAQYQARHPGWRPATEVYEELIHSRLRHGTRLVDLGCGRGGVLEQLGDAVSLPIGLDPDPESLREHRLSDLPRAAARAEAVPLREGWVNIVACSWVLEHLSDPALVFREIRRVLKPAASHVPGGSFVFLTPNAHSLVVLVNRMLRPLQGKLVPRLYGRSEADTFLVQYRANTPGRITALAQESGLTVEQIRLIEDPSYFAFNPVMFRLSTVLARVTPPVHLVGVLRRD